MSLSAEEVESIARRFRGTQIAELAAEWHDRGEVIEDQAGRIEDLEEMLRTERKGREIK